jgi:hypothetical protein
MSSNKFKPPQTELSHSHGMRKPRSRQIQLSFQPLRAPEPQPYFEAIMSLIYMLLVINTAAD